jgi:hypothetical protein
MAKRELIMHRHVTTVLSRLGPEGKIILMAHNQHLAKDDDGIKAPEVGAGPGGGLVPSTGCHINSLFPEEVFSSGCCTTADGTVSPFHGSAAKSTVTLPV